MPPTYEPLTDDELDDEERELRLLRLDRWPYAEKALRLVAEIRRLRTFLLTLNGGLVGPPAAARAWDRPVPLDPGTVLSDEEVNAAEAVVRGAIRWTDVTGPTKIATSFDLLMVELRRLRLRR